MDEGVRGAGFGGLKSGWAEGFSLISLAWVPIFGNQTIPRARPAESLRTRCHPPCVEANTNENGFPNGPLWQKS